MERERQAGFLRQPTQEEVRSLAAQCHLSPGAAELAELHANVATMLDLLDRIDDLPQPELRLTHLKRDPGQPSRNEDDPYKAFIRRCTVEGATDGPLAGWRVGLKDNIKVAGIPMTNGSKLLEGFVPSLDATVVTRLLDAGATIVGKLNMDDWSFSGTGETSAYGSARNPRNPSYSAGGSSSGAGVAVALKLVDLALGVDEGGSGRIPASWCGVVSLKATHGLIPMFGLTYLEHTTDFICPTARNVERVAKALEVLAGDDPLDPQFVRDSITTEPYASRLDIDFKGPRIGVVNEGLESSALEPDVLIAFEQAVKLCEDMGAAVERGSAPYWLDARAIWNGFVVHSFFDMVESNLEGFNRKGYCDPAFQQAFANARMSGGADLFPPVMKTLLVAGAYLRNRYKGVYFSKATNLRHHMRLALDAILRTYDVLLTPTTPMKAFALLQRKVSMTEVVRDWASSMCHNTYPTNVTGHPSLSIPCGTGEHGLPIGMRIIGPSFGEAKVLAVGHALEQAIGRPYA
jgi:amidase